MKKNMIIGLAMGMLTVGALSASAADACEGCADKQAVQQFTQETKTLASTLKAKDIELRELYAFDRIDNRKMSALEAEMKELKDQIKAAAVKYGITCVQS